MELEGQSGQLSIQEPGEEAALRREVCKTGLRVGGFPVLEEVGHEGVGPETWLVFSLQMIHLKT